MEPSKPSSLKRRVTFSIDMRQDSIAGCFCVPLALISRRRRLWSGRSLPLSGLGWGSRKGVRSCIVPIWVLLALVLGALMVVYAKGFESWDTPMLMRNEGIDKDKSGIWTFIGTNAENATSYEKSPVATTPTPPWLLPNVNPLLKFALFTLVLVTAGICMVPISIFNIAAGAMFQPLWVAFLVNVIATTVASAAGLLVGRLLVRGWVLQMFGVEEFAQNAQGQHSDTRGLQSSASSITSDDRSISDADADPSSSDSDDVRTPILNMPETDSRRICQQESSRCQNEVASDTGIVTPNDAPVVEIASERRVFHIPWLGRRSSAALERSRLRRRRRYMQFLAVDRAVTENV
ncbi:hypothetical protein M427DRAFT_50642 [Gonapodya prolifera JEL478]|uniref:Uncharacterized protein n=1 Tax=Gonapodya prolifera (strain JEL478) TaxID=1344416 RepID=A0A139AZZ5_GONPJ|nr:hypothetical protein M427DRAFT_50642 [Gonapodya prolifera JEL478]|eukprot:KXS22316.1 hypothetical protein M427DRAFT_50642 [Gonapodya prolifera JEL478]